mmetsp:Transcript_139217/g.388481  ORF Transcript_139217/g.388481 Transcript_139217/m.388481 type:complete len:742 (-) Transcript_139217:177-2402(-)
MWRAARGPHCSPRRVAWRARPPATAAAALPALPVAVALAARGRRTLFFQRTRPRLFDIEGLETPRDFPRLADEAIKEACRELDGVGQKGPEQIVAALDNASNGLCRIADAAELCRNVHPDARFVEAANQAVQAISAYMGEVNLDAGIYEGMRRAEASRDFASLPLEARAVLHHMRVSMEHEGIHLPDAEKAECLQLLEREQELSFGIVQRQEQLRQTVLSQAGGDASGVWMPLDSVAEALGHQATHLPRRRGAAKEEVLVVPDSPWAEQVLKSASCAEARRCVHEAQQAPDERGEEEMAELLCVRQLLARLRGYKTWCEYAQREALLASPEHVASFLDAAWERIRPGLASEMRVLASEKQRLGLGEPVLEAWDVPLLLHRCRQQREQDNHVAEYLTYSSLMRGVELILSELLDLSFVMEEPGPGEVWHPSVQKYTLREREGGRILGVLYLDPFMRPGKVVQSAQFTLQGSKHLGGGTVQIPVTTLVYALPVGTVGLPLSYAITFMHEIGHAVHSLLSETTFQHLSGTRGTVDFVEFPSHLFEHFVLDPGCLTRYAAHAKTGAPLPLAVGQGCLKSRQHFAHFEAAQQLMYAVVDQAFYSCIPAGSPSGSASASSGGGGMEVRRHMASAIERFDRELEGPFNGRFTSFLGLSRPSKFDHLVHYGGSYYCYLFNRALSAHVWRHGFQADPFSAKAGARLRGLLRGGSVVQSLEAIETLCPGAGGFRAEEVPLDAFAAQLGVAG